ncbi:MAG TPA: alcohol dehydrogenase catalytic domain-containing protein [Pyrinomonadaceae bacterium]|jgi:threonine dehydrogenase-like Zn-dependent dehydrogenase|nr:alcohol dehydrogenase catalytic domain-containing protein [Pyrinomonadaceae bacterium]
MRALRYENGELALAEVDAPRDDAREAVVRVVLAGVCNTDLEIVRGYAGFVGTLGHEFVGVVESAPDASLVGRRVVGEINAGCGICALCVGGDARHCPGRTVLGIVGRDGAFAEFLRLPVENLLPVPDGVEDERAVFAEPLAAACGILERVEIRQDARVAVVGDGKLGLLCAQALKAQTAAPGVSVTLIGKHENKLAIARKRGVETALAGDLRGDFEHAFDVVVEASGASSGFALALRLVRPRGTLVLKSTFHGATEIDAARIVVEEISIVGSRCGRFAPALELLARDAVDVTSLITDQFALADGLRAMQRATERGVLKVLLRP